MGERAKRSEFLLEREGLRENVKREKRKRKKGKRGCEPKQQSVRAVDHCRSAVFKGFTERNKHR